MHLESLGVTGMGQQNPPTLTMTSAISPDTEAVGSMTKQKSVLGNLEPARIRKWFSTTLASVHIQEAERNTP